MMSADWASSAVDWRAISVEICPTATIRPASESTTAMATTHFICAILI